MSKFLDAKIGKPVPRQEIQAIDEKTLYFINNLSSPDNFESALVELFVDAKLQFGGWHTFPTEAEGQPDNYAVQGRGSRMREILVECKFITSVSESAVRSHVKKSNRQFRRSPKFKGGKCPTLLVIGLFPSEAELLRVSFSVQEAVLFVYQTIGRLLQPESNRAISNVCIIWDSIYASSPGIGARLLFTAHRNCLYRPNLHAEVVYPVQEEPVSSTSIVVQEHDHSFPKLNEIKIAPSMLHESIPRSLKFSKEQVTSILADEKTVSSSNLTIAENKEFVISLKAPRDDRSEFVLIVYTLQPPILQVLTAWRIPPKRIPESLRSDALGLFEFVIDNCGKPLTNGCVVSKILRGFTSVEANGGHYPIATVSNKKCKGGYFETPFAVASLRGAGERVLVTIHYAACLSHDRYESWIKH